MSEADNLAGLVERLRNGPLFDGDIDDTLITEQAADALASLSARNQSLERQRNNAALGFEQELALKTQLAGALRAVEADKARLVEAVRPFVSVLENDIGCDETDEDFFMPISAYNARAPLLTIGHFRRLAAALSPTDAVKNGHGGGLG